MNGWFYTAGGENMAAAKAMYPESVATLAAVRGGFGFVCCSHNLKITFGLTAVY